MDDKRKRNINFSLEECELLLVLAEQEKGVIECKKTDNVSCVAKDRAWGRVAEEFNRSSGKVYREKKELKMKFDNLKKASKRKFAAEKRSIWGTGGGAPYNPDITPVDIKIKDIVGNDSITGITSEFDSDATLRPSSSFHDDGEPTIFMVIEDTQQPSTSKATPLSGEVVNRSTDWAHYTPESLRQPRSFALMPEGLQEHLAEAESIQNEGDKTAVNSNNKNEQKNKLANYVQKRKEIMKNRPFKKRNEQETVIWDKVAQAKLELIELQKSIAAEQHEAFLREHALKMEILQADLENKMKQNQLIR